MIVTALHSSSEWSFPEALLCATFNSSVSFSFFSFSLSTAFSSQRRAFAFRSLAPPEITPDFWKRVPSKATVCKRSKTELKVNSLNKISFHMCFIFNLYYIFKPYDGMVLQRQSCERPPHSHTLKHSRRHTEGLSLCVEAHSGSRRSPALPPEALSVSHLWVSPWGREACVQWNIPLATQRCGEFRPQLMNCLFKIVCTSK